MKRLDITMAHGSL